MTPENLLRDTLAALGSTSAEVADTLRARGVKGCSAASACPVAQAVRSKFEEHYPGCKVGVSVLVFCTYVGLDGGPEIGVMTPEACCDFIQEFDAGAHQDLYEERP